MAARAGTARTQRMRRWGGDDEEFPVADASPRAVPSPPVGVWWARLQHREPGPREDSLLAVNSDRFPDGCPVDLPSTQARGRRPAGWLVEVRYRAANGAVVAIDVAERVADPGLPLWFAEVHHVAAAMPSVSLFAFSGGAFPPGSLVRPDEVALRGVRMSEHVGEVRWWTRSGLVDTVRVQQPFRGRRIGRLLVVVAEGLRTLRGWAPLSGDGRLTDHAAEWLAASPVYWEPRLARRTHHLPEEDEAAPSGVTRLIGDLPTRLSCPGR